MYTTIIAGFPDSSVGKICLQCKRPQFDSWVWKIHCRSDSLSTPMFMDFSCGLAGKESDNCELTLIFLMKS